MNKKRKTQAFFIISLYLILVSIYLAYSLQPAGGYETSIYSAFGWRLIFFILPFLLSILTLIQIKPKYSRQWIYPYTIIIFNSVFILLLPLFRGYHYFGGGSDAYVHMGYMLKILETGHISLVYPFLHVFSSNIYIFIDIPIEKIPIIVSCIFNILFFLSLPLLGKSISRNYKEFKFILIFGSILLLPLNWAPYSRSLHLIPILIYLFYRCHEQIKFLILSILILCSMIFFHPLTSIFLTIMFVLYGLIYYVPISSVQEKYLQIKENKKINYPFFFAFLLIIGIIIWFSSFEERFGSILLRILETRSPPADTYLEAAGMRTISDRIKEFIINFGHYFAYLFTSIYFIINYLVFKKKNNLEHIVIFGSFSLISSLFLFIDIFGGFGRPIFFSILFSVFIISSGLSNISINRDKIKKTIVIIVVFLIFSVSFLNLFPRAQNPPFNNQQYIRTIDYLTENQKNESEIYSGERLSKITRINIFNQTLSSKAPPNNLDFESYPNEDSDVLYLVLNERFKKRYPESLPNYEEHWIFHPDDFERVEIENNVIYSNGEDKILLISSER